MTREGAADYWQVRIALDPEEWEAIRRGLFVEAPAERWNIRLAAGEEGETATLHVDVLATNHDEAEEVAGAIYRQARREAGLADETPLVVGVWTPTFGPEPYWRMLEEARRLIETDRYELAVIRAQTACELFAELALEELTAGLRKPDEKVRALFHQVTLLDRRSRALLQALTGSAIDEQAWWPAYKAHVQRRNGVVHDGLAVFLQEAEGSLAAVRMFIEYLGNLWDRRYSDAEVRTPEAIPSTSRRD